MVSITKDILLIGVLVFSSMSSAIVYRYSITDNERGAELQKIVFYHDEHDSDNLRTDKKQAQKAIQIFQSAAEKDSGAQFLIEAITEKQYALNLSIMNWLTDIAHSDNAMVEWQEEFLGRLRSTFRSNPDALFLDTRPVLKEITSLSEIALALLIESPDPNMLREVQKKLFAFNLSVSKVLSLLQEVFEQALIDVQDLIPLVKHPENTTLLENLILQFKFYIGQIEKAKNDFISFEDDNWFIFIQDRAKGEQIKDRYIAALGPLEPVFAYLAMEENEREEHYNWLIDVSFLRHILMPSSPQLIFVAVGLMHAESMISFLELENFKISYDSMFILPTLRSKQMRVNNVFELSEVGMGMRPLAVKIETFDVINAAEIRGADEHQTRDEL